MRKADIRSVVLAGVLLLTADAVFAAEPVAPSLTPSLRNVFQQEMASIFLASQDIVGALAIGDHITVAARASRSTTASSWNRR